MYIERTKKKKELQSSNGMDSYQTPIISSEQNWWR